MSVSPDPLVPPELRLALEEADGIGFVLYRTFALRRRARHFTVADWRTDAGGLPDAGDAIASGSDPGRAWQLTELAGALCLVELSQGHVTARAAAADRASLAAADGRTRALRAPADAWRDWCSVEYIVDPEQFFGSRPGYMTPVLLRNADVAPQRWRLLILEDCGELLSADARERSGQAVSRLLNLIDGLIGQGLRILVLVTGNEPLDRLHPALSRPGRCASIIDFRPFDGAEASAWLAAHRELEDGGPPAVAGAGAATLSDLYAALRGQRPQGQPAPVGFA